jgi:sucrose-6-phosphate hydrolase SacC (GH32 family)
MSRFYRRQLLACGVLMASLAARAERASAATGGGLETPCRSNVVCAVEAEKRWLLLPVKNGAPRRKFELRAGAEALRAFDVEFADGEPEWWAPLDVSAWQGRTLKLWADALPEGSGALARAKLADEAVPREARYTEAQRPLFHFTALRGRLNDPNGLVYFQGEYHLFFQLFPYGCFSGSKHWGHAVSRDLIHWEELPIALYPDKLGMIFSGSGVVDWKNTSGFQTGAEPPLVLIYTVTGPPRAQALAYSNDRGRTWTKYAGNPVLPEVVHNNRDPKVFWHASSGRWVMALYCGYPEEAPPGGGAPKKGSGRSIEFFVSPNLKQWTSASRVKGFFECPDCFEVPVEGSGEKKWVIHGGGGDYQIGQFDGAAFKPETETLQGPYGGAFYAGQRFSDAPDGRVVQLGWAKMSAAPFEGMPFQQMMNIPCELSLRRTADGLRLARRPVPEVERLRGRRHEAAPGPLGAGGNPLPELRAACFDLRADIEVGTATALVWRVSGNVLVLDVNRQRLVAGKAAVPVPLREGRARLRLLADRCLLECFADDGLVYGAMPLLPAPGGEVGNGLSAYGGEARIRELVADELASAWIPDASGPGAGR